MSATTLAGIREVPGLDGYLDALEERLARTVASHPGLVAAVGNEALAAGGKRLRPALERARTDPDWEVRVYASEALERVQSGEAQLVVGTHALIEDPVEFRKLGLVVIDEQHRFGVLQRKRLREKGASPDVLVMTATPIPRTLAMSLEGLRDFSVIATAPQRRLSIKTFVSSYSQGVIREAREETGVLIEPGDLVFSHVIHHRNPLGQARIGFFFTTTRWQGEPVNRESHKCAGLYWVDPGCPPANTVPYTAAALAAITREAAFSLDGW